MACCLVPTCTNYSRKTNGKGIMYHTLPKNPIVIKLWLIKCKRLDNVNVNNARVCSDHFKPSDYKDDMRNRLLGLKERKILKEDAIPSCNLPNATKPEETSRNERKKKRDILKRAKQRLETLGSGTNCESILSDVSEDIKCDGNQTVISKNRKCEGIKKQISENKPEGNESCLQCSARTQENNALKEKIKWLEREIITVSNEKNKRSRTKNAQINQIRLRMRCIIKKNRELLAQVKTLEKQVKNTRLKKVSVKSVLTDSNLKSSGP